MVITLYTKPGCHLCEAMEQTIRQVQQGRPFDLVIRNILDDQRDERTYRELIPVVLLDGREIARYRLTVAELRAAVDGA